MINLSGQQLRVVKWVGYPAFFAICFMLFLVVTFPAERFIPVVEDQLSNALGRKVMIGDMSISPFGSVTLEQLKVAVPRKNEKKASVKNTDRDQAAGVKAKKPPTLYYSIESLDVDLAMWALLGNRLSFEANADFIGGQVQVSYDAALSSNNGTGASEKAVPGRPSGKPTDAVAEQDAEAPMTLSIAVNDVNLIQFYDLKDLLPMPLFGRLSFGVTLNSPTGRFGDADGEAWIKGSHISLGRGQQKVEVLEGMGPMTVESMAIQSLDVNMRIAKGIGSFKRVAVKSTDLAAFIEGTVRFGDPFARTHLDLYFTFKMLDGYAQKSQFAKTLVDLMPTALARAYRTDGYFGYRYSGLLGKGRFIPQKSFRSAGNSRRTPVRKPVGRPGRSRASALPFKRSTPVQPRPSLAEQQERARELAEAEAEAQAMRQAPEEEPAEAEEEASHSIDTPSGKHPPSLGQMMKQHYEQASQRAAAEFASRRAAIAQQKAMSDTTALSGQTDSGQTQDTSSTDK